MTRARQGGSRARGATTRSTAPARSGDRLVDALVAWGDEDAISARVQEHVDAGTDHVCLQVIHDEDGLPREQWRRLASALIG